MIYLTGPKNDVCQKTPLYTEHLGIQGYCVDSQTVVINNETSVTSVQLFRVDKVKKKKNQLTSAIWQIILPDV